MSSIFFLIHNILNKSVTQERDVKFLTTVDKLVECMTKKMSFIRNVIKEHMLEFLSV